MAGQHGDLNTAIERFENVLPGWWWRVGYCSVSSDASIGPDRTGPDAHLLERREFDEGFHADIRDGNIEEALQDVIEQALVAKGAVSSRPLSHMSGE